MTEIDLYARKRPNQRELKGTAARELEAAQAFADDLGIDCQLTPCPFRAAEWRKVEAARAITGWLAGAAIGCGIVAGAAICLVDGEAGGSSIGVLFSVLSIALAYFSAACGTVELSEARGGWRRKVMSDAMRG